jgi:hypothetical protein
MASDGGLRKIFREHLKDFDWQSVETHITSRGVPDLNYCSNGAEGWIELKSCKHWRVAIRPEQVAWAERRMRKGGRVFLAVIRDRSELYLYHARDMRRLCSERLDAVEPLGRWQGKASQWDWFHIRHLLTRRFE